jgi:hypothetical protein
MADSIWRMASKLGGQAPALPVPVPLFYSTGTVAGRKGDSPLTRWRLGA